MDQFPRWMEKNLELFLRIFRVVYICGPRRCGKASLIKGQLPGPDSVFLDLTSPPSLEAFRNSPDQLFCDLREYRRIGMREIQKEPLLIGEIKADADAYPEKGRFLLTASLSYQALPKETDSLAGRKGTLRLRTLTEGEIQKREPRFLNRVLYEDYSGLSHFESGMRKTLIEKAIRGGYPEILAGSQRERQAFFENYLLGIKEDRLPETFRINKEEGIKELLRALARVSSSLANDSELAKVVSISRPTMSKFLWLLKSQFLIDEVPAWPGFFADGLSKAPRRFLTDSGLLAYLLGIQSYEQLALPVADSQELAGKLIRTWAYCQLAALTELDSEWRLYHFRTLKGLEIDFLLESQNQGYIAVTVNPGERVEKKDFKSALWFEKNLAHGRPVRKIALFLGCTPRDLKDGCIALPFSSLWL